MTNLRNLVACGVAMAVAAVAQVASAQDDLDNLLKALESEAETESAGQAEPAKEAPAAEPAVAAPAEAAPAAATEVPAAETPAVAVETPAEPAAAAAEEPAAAVTAPSEQAKAPVAAATPPAKAVEPGDAELIENIRKTEGLRREALDAQAKREIATARENMRDEEYGEAVRHYGLALRFLNDRPSSKDLRRECEQGVAEGLYRAAMQEFDLGRRERAVKLMEKAIDMRHPKARRVLEQWNSVDDDEETAVATGAGQHRKNDVDYKLSREQIRKHLRRSCQYLAVRDMKRALEECEIVLVNDPYNSEAIRIRNAIQKKRKVILRQEREAARDGMIADIDEAWRPVYAVNAEQLRDAGAETIKKQTGDDPERTMEQDIERRMKEMRLPTISFKPPATIIEAVEFFRTASKDYDRPDIPVEKRGFNFSLKTPQGAIRQQSAQADESEDFAAEEDSASGSDNGLPPIPTITASDISFYDALKLVCDSVDYKFIVRGPFVMVMQKDMSTAELLSRKYDVLDAFLERMTSASADVKEMKSAGFGGGSSRRQEEEGENQEKDWKGFFEQMGVKWPEGSSIMYIKTLGKLYVRNTRENLAEFEKVLQEMGSQPKLIEIETRFVEVKQEDLNSLGFEWILNSDYSLDVGGRLSRALGLRKSSWGTESGSATTSSMVDNKQSINGRPGGFAGGGDGWQNTTTTQGGATKSYENASTSDIGNNSSSTSYTRNYTRTVYPYGSSNAGLIRDPNGTRQLGINAFGGTSSDYNHGNRYLSDVGNHISGEGGSSNDQFMRVNAFLGSADLSMILHMLSQRSDTDLLSAPKVVTKSGENAVIKVVTEYIYPQDYDVQLQSSSSGSSGGSSGNSQSAILAVVEPQNFTMREVGVILDVTPTYSEANGGTIDLELKPQVVDEPTWHNYGMRIPFTGNSASASITGLDGIINSMVSAVTTLGGSLTEDQNAQIANRVVDTSMSAIDALSTSGTQNMTWYDAPMEQPFFPVRSIDSKVSITPGSTVVMGGLITEARKAMDDKVPFLGDLPFVGRLFRSHAEQTIKKNLLIFVTGRLITPSGRELSINSDASSTEAEVKAAPTAE